MPQWYQMSASVKPGETEYLTVPVKLPDGVTCEHCVMQWTWWTGHNCAYECDPAICGTYSERRNPVKPEVTWQYPMCETKYPKPGQWPQMFKNCMDIRIVAGVCAHTLTMVVT